MGMRSTIAAAALIWAGIGAGMAAARTPHPAPLAVLGGPAAAPRSVGGPSVRRGAALGGVSRVVAKPGVFGPAPKRAGP